ncbi:hypothetical protein Pfo_027531 [Paulownia fortunei]|nr:hypothetical protein Pfo_027531 [Paulownia fortunei]
MSSSFADSFDQFGGDSPAADSTHPFEDGYLAPDSFSTSSRLPRTLHLISTSPADFYPGTNASGPILLPPAEMEPEEGYALREWRRRRRRDRRNSRQIIVEANEYKVEFHRKRQVTRETNRATNREKEKLNQHTFLASQEKLHDEADKDYWRSIAELTHKEVLAIEKRKGKKDQEKKPSIAVVQGPKPGKPTDLASLPQILLKLKHNTPPHLKPSPLPSPDAKTDASAAPKAAAMAVSTLAVA